MATYLLVDTMNTFFRARHVVRGDISEKVGMAIHITLNAINKCYKQFNADHVVFALEGRSWRKDFYAPSKNLFGFKLDTFSANVLVIWLMTILLTITLYFDVLRKLIENSGFIFKLIKLKTTKR